MSTASGSACSASFGVKRYGTNGMLIQKTKQIATYPMANVRKVGLDSFFYMRCVGLLFGARLFLGVFDRLVMPRFRSVRCHDRLNLFHHVRELI